MEDEAPGTHPIAQRLSMIGAEWTAFTDNSGARLLRWLCALDEVVMVEGFVAQESEPEACTTPDLFVRLDEAFEHASAHGYVLCKAFRAAWDEAGLGASFAPPVAPRGDDIGAFVGLLRAYHAQQQGQIAHLSVFLNPAAVRDAGAYQRWLQRCVHACPEALRVVVVDAVDAPMLEELAQQEPKLVVSTRCDLDMPSALEELAGAAGAESPGAQFRQLFVRLGNHAKQGDLAGALPLAALAGQLCERMRSPHLAAGVQTLLAGLYGAAGKPLEALRCYAEVDRYGRRDLRARAAGEQRGKRAWRRAGAELRTAAAARCAPRPGSGSDRAVRLGASGKALPRSGFLLAGALGCARRVRRAEARLVLLRASRQARRGLALRHEGAEGRWRHGRRHAPQLHASPSRREHAAPFRRIEPQRLPRGSLPASASVSRA